MRLMSSWKKKCKLQCSHPANPHPTITIPEIEREPVSTYTVIGTQKDTAGLVPQLQALRHAHPLPLRQLRDAPGASKELQRGVHGHDLCEGFIAAEEVGHHVLRVAAGWRWRMVLEKSPNVASMVDGYWMLLGF